MHPSTSVSAPASTSGRTYRSTSSRVAGPDVALVDPGAAIAKRTRTLLAESAALATGPGGVELRATDGSDLWPLYRSFSR